MRIALIGAGRVAACLGPRLKEAGHELTCVYSRTEESASALASVLDIPFTTSLSEIPDSQVYLTMLADDAIVSLAPEIVSCCGKGLLLHTAGSIPLSVWSSAGARNCGVLYLMQSFSKNSVIDWSQVSAFIEGESCMIRELALSITPNVMELSSDGRRRMHLAAVFASNFSNRMFSISQELLERDGVPFCVLMPLIRETVNKLESMDPHESQTGPAMRGDRKVIEEHLEMLQNDPAWADIYRIVSKDINKSL